MQTSKTTKYPKSIFDMSEEMTLQLLQAGEVDMHYRRGINNTQTGNIRTELSLKCAVRFGLTSTTILSVIYKMKPRQVREHLNKLVKRGLLKRIDSMRSIDGYVYIPTSSGAKMVAELLDVQVHFRRTKVGLEINQNTVNHDSITQLILLTSLTHTQEYDDCFYYKYSGFVTEHEIKKIFKDTCYRIVDGMLHSYLPDTDTHERKAIEVEHSFKNTRQRSDILIAYLKLLKDKVYNNITLVSHNSDILRDAKRINDKLIIDLCNVRKKGGSTMITGEDAALLEAKIFYDDTYCKELTQLFYR